MCTGIYLTGEAEFNSCEMPDQTPNSSGMGSLVSTARQLGLAVS